MKLGKILSLFLLTCFSAQATSPSDWDEAAIEVDPAIEAQGDVSPQAIPRDEKKVRNPQDAIDRSPVQPVKPVKADDSSMPEPEFRPSKNVQVLATLLNVRTSKRAIVCQVPQGTELVALGRHADGKRIQVRIDQPGCPEYGYVDSDYVTGGAIVQADRLGLRSSAGIEGDNRKCSLDNGAKLNILGGRKNVGDITWIKVSLSEPIEGCPSDGYVARSYLESTTFKDLPVVSSTLEDCPSCANGGGRAPGSSRDTASDLQALSDGLGAKVDDIDDTYKGDANQSTRIRKLVAAAHKAAEKCRAIAPHVCKRLTGTRKYCGQRCGASRSKGWCKAGVREAFEQSFGYSLPGGSALAAKGFLDRKMTRLPGVSCKDAPVGAVCLSKASYHNYGHIEIKTAKNSYCSDFCAARPTTRNHTPVAVYMP